MSDNNNMPKDENLKEIKKKRQLKNFLLDPSFQLRFCTIVIGLTFLFTVFITTYFYFSMRDAVAILLEIFESFDVPSEQVTSFIIEKVSPIVKTMLGLLAGFFVIVSCVIIVETHKVVGAEFAIKRYIREKLKNLYFSEKLHLRKKDYLTDISSELNNLADKLKETYGGSEYHEEEQYKKTS